MQKSSSSQHLSAIAKLSGLCKKPSIPPNSPLGDGQNRGSEALCSQSSQPKPENSEIGNPHALATLATNATNGSDSHKGADATQMSASEAPDAGIDVDALIRAAGHGLAITPKELRDELVDDMNDIRAGVLSPSALRLTAEALSARETKQAGADETEAITQKPGSGVACCGCGHYLRVDGQATPRPLWRGPESAWKRRIMVG